MKKQARQQVIRNLVENQPVGTQEELTKLLQEAGIDATQATISRDIREMGLSKVRSADGQRYVILNPQGDALEERFRRVLRDGFVSMDTAQSILVIRTVSGMAMAVAAAVDAMHFEEVVGCIAGDDTIFVAVRTAEDTKHLMDRIREVLQ